MYWQLNFKPNIKFLAWLIFPNTLKISLILMILSLNKAAKIIWKRVRAESPFVSICISKFVIEAILTRWVIHHVKLVSNYCRLWKHIHPHPDHMMHLLVISIGLLRNSTFYTTLCHVYKLVCYKILAPIQVYLFISN